MTRTLTTLILAFSCIQLLGQVYAETKTQHRFAQTYVGFNTQIIPASGSIIFQNQEYEFQPTVIPRFTIGGLHFWGKLDFNINFPLATFGNTSLAQGGKVRFSSGADLSARYYPWRLMDGKLRPFTGLSFNTMKISLENAAQEVRAEGFITSSILAGLSYSYKGWQLNTELMVLPRNERTFYGSIQEKHLYRLPRAYLSLGVARVFDFTLSNEKPKLSGKTKALEEKLLGAGKLNSISIGIASNGSYFLKSPTFSEEFTSLPKHKGSINMEYGLGYFFHRHKFHLGLTYRTYSSNSVSYELEHVVRRKSLALEAIKFVWDYNGFVPFIGVSLGIERWAAGMFVDDIQQGETARTSILSPGVIFGWDIVPSPLETWVLRTNLRYYPYQQINDFQGKTSRVDQFEFNFIQFVFYPNRWWNIRDAKKKSNS
ncbi:MAG: hypothetical protein RIC03_04940 [Cyclobacteriaceae bacterium]